MFGQFVFHGKDPLALRLQLDLSAQDIDPGRDTAVFKICGAIVHGLGCVQLRARSLDASGTGNGLEIKVGCNEHNELANILL